MRIVVEGSGGELLSDRVWQAGSAILWAATALVVTGLSLRFGMRALGVRDDIAFPGLVYTLTTPLVTPFYQYFPASERFDEAVIEVAALAAAGSALAVALGIYIMGLLLLRNRELM